MKIRGATGAFAASSTSRASGVSGPSGASGAPGGSTESDTTIKQQVRTKAGSKYTKERVSMLLK